METPQTARETTKRRSLIIPGVSQEREFNKRELFPLMSPEQERRIVWEHAEDIYSILSDADRLNLLQIFN